MSTGMQSSRRKPGCSEDEGDYVPPTSRSHRRPAKSGPRPKKSTFQDDIIDKSANEKIAAAPLTPKPYETDDEEEWEDVEESREVEVQYTTEVYEGAIAIGVDHPSVPPSQRPPHLRPPPNDRRHGRKLVPWHCARMVEKLVLIIQYECHRAGLQIPWDKVVHRLCPNHSGAAALQFLNKMRGHLIVEGHMIPPILGKANVRQDPMIRGYVKDESDPHISAVRPLLWSETFKHLRKSIESEEIVVGSGRHKKGSKGKGLDQHNKSQNGQRHSRCPPKTPEEKAKIEKEKKVRAACKAKKLAASASSAISDPPSTIGNKHDRVESSDSEDLGLFVSPSPSVRTQSRSAVSRNKRRRIAAEAEPKKEDEKAPDSDVVLDAAIDLALAQKEAPVKVQTLRKPRAKPTPRGSSIKKAKIAPSSPGPVAAEAPMFEEQQTFAAALANPYSQHQRVPQPSYQMYHPQQRVQYQPQAVHQYYDQPGWNYNIQNYNPYHPQALHRQVPHQPAVQNQAQNFGNYQNLSNANFARGYNSAPRATPDTANAISDNVIFGTSKPRYHTPRQPGDDGN